MNYRAHYSRLMDRARGRALVEYSERHHVVPKCLGGTNGESNIVRLTPEEHFVAHQLLVKMHPGDQRLAFAAVMLTADARGLRQSRGNKLYGWLKRKAISMPFTNEHRAHLSAARIGKKHSPETIKKMSGKVRSAETREKLSESLRGRKHSTETRAKIGAGHKGKAISTAQREMLRAAMTGKIHSPEARAKMSAAKFAYWQARRDAEEQRSCL